MRRQRPCELALFLASFYVAVLRMIKPNSELRADYNLLAAAKPNLYSSENWLIHNIQLQVSRQISALWFFSYRRLPRHANDPELLEVARKWYSFVQRTKIY